MLLFIDTSDEEAVKLALIDKNIVWHKFSSYNLSEDLILEIKKFFQKQKTNFEDLSKVAVVTGPGSFSKIRTAVATANALAFALKIPVLGISKDEVPVDLKKLLLMIFQKMTVPVYDREPNITKSSNK